MPDEPTVPAEPTSVVGVDGSFVENWSEKYGEDNQAHLSRYKNLDSLVKSHIDTRKKVGKNPDSMVEIPTDESSDEVKTAYSKALGRPDTNDLYEYKMPTEMETKLGPIDDKKMGAFREFAHGQNWNQKQFAAALDFYHTNMAGDIDTASISFNEQQAAAKTESEAALKKEWLDGYDDRVLRANSVLRKYGGEEAVESFNAQNSPLMTKFLDNIAEAMSEDTLKGLAGTPSASATGIKSQLNEVYGELDKIMKENPINFKQSPRYKELIEKKHALNKQRAPK